MADLDISLSPDKPSTAAPPVYADGDDNYDISFHDVPSSPFVAHLDYDEPKENIAPNAVSTPVKPLLDFEDDNDHVLQSAFKVSPEKKFGSKERVSPTKMSPVKNLMEEFEDAALRTSTASRRSPKKSSPAKPTTWDRSGSAMSNHSRGSRSPCKTPRSPSLESQLRAPAHEDVSQSSQTHDEPALRDNEGLTRAMKFMDDSKAHGHYQLDMQQVDHVDLDTTLENTDFNPDGPELTSGDMDDTCFSTFSEMPGLDMTKFASLKQSPSKASTVDVSNLATLSGTHY